MGKNQGKREENGSVFCEFNHSTGLTPVHETLPFGSSRAFPYDLAESESGAGYV